MVLLCYAIWIYLLLVFGRIVLSWVSMASPPMPGTFYAQVSDFFTTATEPVLAPVRGMLPPVRLGGAGLDLSPLVVFIGGQIVLRLIGC